MNENGNMFNNIDKIKSLSKLMSMDNGGGMDTEKILNALAAAKSMGMLGGNEIQEKRPDIVASDTQEYVGPAEYEPQNEGIRVIKAAIPFLDREYQKNLFLAVKLIEMNEDFDSGAMSLQCQSIREGTDEEQREAMLKAVRSQLSNENGRRLDVVLKMMEARRLASKMR